MGAASCESEKRKDICLCVFARTALRSVSVAEGCGPWRRTGLCLRLSAGVCVLLSGSTMESMARRADRERDADLLDEFRQDRRSKRPRRAALVRFHRHERQRLGYWRDRYDARIAGCKRTRVDGRVLGGAAKAAALSLLQCDVRFAQQARHFLRARR